MFRSSFFKNIAFLSAAGLLGKIAVIIALPILSRLYDQAAFGLYSIYFSMLMAFPMIASMRLDFAVTISREKNTARLLAAGAFLSLCVVSVLTALVLLALINYGILPFDPLIIPFICLSIFFVGGCDVLRYWGVRQGHHKIYGKSQVSQSFSLVIAQLSLFYIGADLSGLVVGDTFSRLIMFLVLFQVFGRDVYSNIKWASFFRVIKAYILRFITYTITNLLHLTPNIILPIFITSVYSQTETGNFLMGYQVLFSITGVFISSLAQVFLGKIAHLQKDPIHLRKNLNKVVLVLALIGLPCLAILMFFGPSFYAFVFGDKWYRAGEFAQVLAPAIYTQLVMGPILSVFIVFKKPEKQLIIDFAWALLTISCLAYSWYYSLSSLQMLTIFSALTTVMFITFYIQMLFMLNNQKRPREH